MSKELNTIETQVEQIKLAQETTRALLKGCPEDITVAVDDCFTRAVQKAKLRVAHIEVCTYSEESRSCECGLVCSEDLV